MAPVRGCVSAVRTLPGLPGCRPVPASSAGKQTWPTRETRRTLRTTWATTCRSSLVTSRGRSPAAGREEARALSGAAGLGRRAGGTEACRGAPGRGRTSGLWPATGSRRISLSPGRPKLWARVLDRGGVCSQGQRPFPLRPLCVQNLAPRKRLKTEGEGGRGYAGP